MYHVNQWRSQKAEKSMHIKGRLLDRAMILYNCIPFQMGTSQRERILSFMSSSLKYGKNHFYHIK